MPRLEHLETFSLKFSSLRFVNRINLLCPEPSSFLYGLLFSILENYKFQVYFLTEPPSTRY